MIQVSRDDASLETYGSRNEKPSRHRPFIGCILFFESARTRVAFFCLQVSLALICFARWL